MSEYTCPDCGRAYKTQRGLMQHIGNKHGPDDANPEEFQRLGHRTLEPPVESSIREEGVGLAPVLAPPEEAPDLEAEARRQLQDLGKALGLDVLARQVGDLTNRVNQLNRELAQGAAPTQAPGGFDLTKLGITEDTVKMGVKMITEAIFKGPADEDEVLVRAIVEENKKRKRVNMAEKVRLIMDTIDSGGDVFVKEPDDK